MKRPVWLGLLLAGFLTMLACPAPAGLTVYYVRHGQGGHNVQSEYDGLGIPPAQRPDWVGDQNRFTPLGAYQIQALASNLMPFHFDFIAVSPVWRTRQTILPYLKAAGRTAEIWPELAETAFIGDSAEARAGRFDRSLFNGVRDVELPAEERPFFHLRSDGTGSRWLSPTNPPQAAALALKVEEMLRTRFGTNDASVLLVGHGTAGLTLVRTLTRDPQVGPHHMNNTRLWCVDLQPDGTFKLRFHNKAADAAGREQAPGR